MATRAITTNQPEVSCDVCGRRLLRGERPDVFLASGSRRVVCELCIPRATGEGWLRESEALTGAGMRGSRPRRGRSLLDRLRQRRGIAPQPDEADEQQGAAWSRGRTGERRRAREDSWQDAPLGGWGRDEADWQGEQVEQPSGEGGYAPLPAMDALVEPASHAPVEPASHAPAEPASRAHATHEPATHAPASHAPARHELATDELATHEWATDEQARERELRSVTGVSKAQATAKPRVSVAVAQAIEVFNASECSTRVAGIARALGQPSVTVSRVAERDRVTIIVAWELCWYRYEIDLSQAPATIGLIGEGTELEELSAEDRLSNAVADERGELSLLR